jgi:peptide/nickel transport system permease protein
MGQFLRRVLWLLPALVIVTVLGFWLISGASRAQGGHSLPTFINLRTEDVSTRAWKAAEQIALTNSGVARARLARLGGAALPYVLPRLDSLRPEGRERVALALLPVATRMGLLPAGSSLDGPRALSLWVDFWEEHFVDFRSARVKRIVERTVDQATELRTQELKRLDTFVLDEVMLELTRFMAQRSAPTDKQQRAVLALTNAAAHATGLTWTLREETSKGQARSVAARWLSWWAEARFEFTAPQGIERFLAPLLQTRYASWAREAARTRFGIGLDGNPILVTLKQRFPLTLLLCFCGCCGLLVGSLLASLLTRIRSANTTRRFTTAIWLVTPALLWAASRVIPIDRACLDCNRQVEPLALASACIACLVWSGMLALQQQLAVEGSRGLAPWDRHYRIMGVGPLRLSWLALRHSAGVAAARLLPNLAHILTASTVLEVAFELPGLGPYTLEAISHAQVNWLMAVTIATAAVFGLLQVLADTSQQSLTDVKPSFFRLRRPRL